VIAIDPAQLAKVIGGTASSTKAVQQSILQLREQTSKLSGGDVKSPGGTAKPK
jgi:hypothetical protein